MEASSYVDIYATKGIEYLFILGFFLALIFFWRYLNFSTKLAVSNRPGISPTPWFSLEESIFYHQGHSWARPDANDLVTVGIDDFTQRLLGKSNALEVPQIGGKIRQGEKGWALCFGSKAIDVLSPVEGEVVAINEEVLRDPNLLNRDPYGRGWLMKVKVTQMKRNLTNLLSGELAMAWMKETVDNLHQRMAGDYGVALQDGGIPVEGIAQVLSPDNWEEVARAFLLT